MSKMSRTVGERRASEKEKPVVNFMGGISYELNPLETLKMVSASSIFGEPQYYRDGEFAVKGIKDGVYSVNPLMVDSVILSYDKYNGMKTSSISAA